MKRALIILTLVLSTVPAVSKAGEIKVNLPEVKLSGGISTTGFNESRAESYGSSTNNIKLTDAVLELSGGDKFGGFDIALGSILEPTVLGSVNNDNVAIVGDHYGILWGYVSALPLKGLEIDAGVLTTNVGYELAATYLNPNITYGLVWNSQPFIYKGARATYNLTDNIQVYAEYDRGDELNGNSKDHAFAVGSIGTVKDVSYKLTYFDYENYKNLIDFTLGYKIKNVQLALNGDYQWLDEDSSKKGYGVVLYIIPEFRKISIPLRAEYVKDKDNSGIYGFNNKGTYSLTITPTYKLSDDTTVRAEYSYVKSNDDNAFNGSDHKGIASVQLSFTF
ncbi:Putative beta-barrel porin-2, OmpL-like. bbp2 [Balnearium lithotrophicum]|uniref:Beta-barrel porin-2, OmpL-like. bbp2 n=1 Tax=Balnearium lithotrophicum TaxID=223788 RepID=A0A521CWA9_9BACT|nr:outer membrane beta-barrel protein [Balnearium lithotrophicum]SMO63698.1 Putative beta-barrel porin-2, OmpL-like. bbp2 [Balnearium lithotrophicum]